MFYLEKTLKEGLINDYDYYSMVELNYCLLLCATEALSLEATSSSEDFKLWYKIIKFLAFLTVKTTSRGNLMQSLCGSTGRSN